nr:MAG TPA: hypothetical protein [Caudoviricetes sp.]
MIHCPEQAILYHSSRYFASPGIFMPFWLHRCN